MGQRAAILAFLPLLAIVAIAGCAGPKGGRSTPGSGAILDAASSPEALVALADSAIAAADPELAWRALKRAAEMAPRSAAVRVGFGRYYTATLRYKDAKTEFEGAALLDPSSPEPDYWLGVAYQKAGEIDLAVASLSRALEIDPTHAGARAELRLLLERRYRAAGIPAEYASIGEQSTVSRGELGVMLAVELGADPDRPAWRSDEAILREWPDLDAAWGSRWLRASLARRWLEPYADGELHLEDPVTRGALALIIVGCEARLDTDARADSSRALGKTTSFLASNVGPVVQFPDLGARHYLGRAAARSVRLGLPVHSGGRFEPLAFATGLETLRALHGLARSIGAVAVVSGALGGSTLLK